MTGRRRIIALAALALAAPIPALAGSGGNGGESPATLSVTASLDHCGIVESQVICKIDAGWNSLEGAEHYELSVTGADGSVVDYGQTSGLGSSVWVPYAGPGTYSVTVTAWGTPPGEDEPAVLAREAAVSGGAVGTARQAPAGETSTDAPGGESEVTPSQEAEGGSGVGAEAPVEPPPCEEAPPVDDAPVSDTPPPSDGSEAPIEATPEATDALEAQAELPDSVECL